jgi:hypothetical protein
VGVVDRNVRFWCTWRKRYHCFELFELLELVLVSLEPCVSIGTGKSLSGCWVVFVGSRRRELGNVRQVNISLEQRETKTSRVINRAKGNMIRVKRREVISSRE